MLKPIIFLLFFVLISCATRHDTMKGSVALKIDESNGIVCTDANKTKVGDKLYIYNNECKRTTLRDKRGAPDCKLVKSGEVEITKLVNEHYSEFKTLSPIKFEEGSIIRP